MDPILVGLASSMAWALIKGSGTLVKHYVLGGPEEERALYGVLEPALADSFEEATAGADAGTTERMKDALERWFSDPDVRAEVLSSIVEVKEPDVGLLENRFDALGEEGIPLDLETFVDAFRRGASLKLEEETQKKGGVLANMVNGGRIKALLEERRAESQRLAEHRRGSLPRHPGPRGGREYDIDGLLKRVLSAMGSDAASGGHRGPRTIVVFGLPGVGKSSTIAKLAYRDELEAHFPDGVLWSSLGVSPDLLSVVAGWSRSFDGPEQPGLGCVE
jgi:hypothetical protein